VIIDLPRFLAAERHYWQELEMLLRRLEESSAPAWSLGDLTRLHYLYERSAAGLAQLHTFAAEPDTRRYLEALVARAYAEIHVASGERRVFSFARWFFETFPQTFRRRIASFHLAVATTLAGCAFGAGVVLLDPGAREALMPFEGLREPPADRVAREEATTARRNAGARGTFSAFLMTHNTRVAILCLAMGMTFGVGTFILLFYNGVILGAVAADYVAAGQTTFLAGWLLPHGSIEIPAILIAGQAGLVLGATLLGRGRRESIRERLRRSGPDLATLIAGAAVLLVWAGLVEAFFSQDHEPRIPYSFKIGFGLVELMLLSAFLGIAGRGVVWVRNKRRRFGDETAGSNAAAGDATIGRGADARGERFAGR
jgi:uncharacterized membrane protein SpoIIM required for sporulation